MRARMGAATVGLLALLGVAAPPAQADHKGNHSPGGGKGGGPGSSETLVREFESFRDVCTPVPAAICRADGHANASESSSNVALFSPSLYGLASIPLPFDAAGEWSRVNRAAHVLAAPVSQVTYRWESNVIEARSDIDGTQLSAWAELGLRVQHTACPACTATVRHVLVGDDPHDNQPAAASSSSFTQPVLEVVLRDPSGAPLPAGTVEVRTVLAGHVQATAAPTWQGLGTTYVRLFEGTLTARSEQ